MGWSSGNSFPHGWPLGTYLWFYCHFKRSWTCSPSNLFLTPKAEFRSMMARCNLLDLSFNGDPFTRERAKTSKRLDHALGNLDWCLKFDKSKNFHLPKLKFDHAPILINFENKKPVNRRRRPFRFEASWLTLLAFNQIVDENWRGSMANLSVQLRRTFGGS